ncbi:MAG: hypothetical protein ACI80V_003075 [Rhodothermales bacterium]
MGATEGSAAGRLTDGSFADETWSQFIDADSDISITAIVVEPETGDVTFGTSDGWLLTASQPAGVSVSGTLEIPEDYALGQNYPNPFNPITTIPYSVPVSGPVELAIFDLLGREIAQLHVGIVDAGRHAALWDASEVPSGVYLYRMRAGSFTSVRRLVLLK